MLEVKNIAAGYSKKRVINDISFSCSRGEICTIIGPNGSGKSTLLKAISGIIKTESGSVLLDKADLLSLKRDERAKKISYLPQNRRVPEINVEGLVLHGRFPYLSYPRRYREEDFKATYDALSVMGILNKKDRRLDELSGGERQKAYVAMCLAQNTDIILLDEPTSALDIKHRYQFLDELRKLAERGKCIIMVAHDITDAMAISEKIVVMDKGEVMIEASPEEVFQSTIIQKTFGIGIEKHCGRYYPYKLD